LSTALGMNIEDVARLLREQEAAGKVRSVEHFGKRWWEWKEQ